MAEDCRRYQQWCPYDPHGSVTQVIAKVLSTTAKHVNVSRGSRWAHAVLQAAFRTRYDLSHNILDVAIDTVPEYASAGT